MKIIEKNLEGLDIFGQKIEFNFGKKGQTHKSICGGIVTIIVMANIIGFGLYRSYVMFNFSQTNTSSVAQYINPNDLGNVYQNDTQIVFFASISKDDYKLFFNNMSQFISVNYFNILKNYATEKSFVLEKYEVKICTQKDFGQDEASIKAYKNIQSSFYLNLCPDLKDKKDFYFAGDYNSNSGNSTTLQLKVERCNKSEQMCASDQEIDDFLSDFAIWPGLYQKQIDFLKFGSEPYFHTLKWLNGYYPSTFYRSFMKVQSFIKLSQVETYDDIIQLGQITFQGSYYDLSYTVENTRPFQRGQRGNEVFHWHIYLDSIKTVHQRQTYSILTLLGDVGGISSILIPLSTLLTSSYSEFNFIMFALTKLYFVKCKCNKIFKSQNSRDDQQNRVIQISLKDKFILFIYVIIEKLTFGFCNFRNIKLKQFYDLGCNYLENDFDLEQVIKNVRKNIQNEGNYDFIIDLDTDQTDQNQIQNLTQFPKTEEIKSNQIQKNNQIEFKISSKSKQMGSDISFLNNISRGKSKIVNSNQNDSVISFQNNQTKEKNQILNSNNNNTNHSFTINQIIEKNQIYNSNFNDSDISFSDDLMIGKNQIANSNFNKVIELNEINKPKISSDENNNIVIEKILREFQDDLNLKKNIRK